jgi:hypothetical protein
MALDERDFFNEKTEPRSDPADLSAVPAQARLSTPLCAADQEGPHFGRRRSRFEVPSHQSLVFLQEGERQPNS